MIFLLCVCSQVYDIPRPQQTEAVYFNRGFEELERPTYDTPRKKSDSCPLPDDPVECDYDVPKAGQPSECITLQSFATTISNFVAYNYG